MGGDYHNRDHEAIRSLTTSWGIKPGDTAQDRIKSFVTAIVGAVKLNTEPSFGKYIGETGLNFSPSMFKRWGFLKEDNYLSDIQVNDWDFDAVDYDPWGPGNYVWRAKKETARE